MNRKPDTEMSEQNESRIEAVDHSANAVEPEKVTAPGQVRASRRGVTVAAFVVTVLAWVMLPLFYPGALGGGVVGLVLSIVSLRQPRGAWRNLGLVSIVASSVLLLVLAIFWAALFMALKYL